MIFALIAMGLVALAGIAELAMEALEEGADAVEERIDELKDDPRVERLLALEGTFNDTEPQFVTGNEGLNETLEGGGASDTIVGNFGDLDTLEGGLGDDLLLVVNGNTAEGGAGADVFQVYPDSNGYITDFRPGTDTLRIDANADLLDQDLPPALDWLVTEDGVELHYTREGEVDRTDETFVVLLGGLQAPPPLEDITFTVYDDRQGEIFEFRGEEINFGQRLEGTDADDSIVLDDRYTDYVLGTGVGDDDVTFDSFRATTYLGAGDDTYISLADSRSENAALDPSETIYGGEGNDVIIGSDTGFEAWGGLGDDTITAVRTDNLGQDVARMSGGAGEDSLTFGIGAEVTGGAGADSFTAVLMPGRDAALSVITDFDPSEDALVIQLDSFYAGPGIATFALDPSGVGSELRVDGVPTLRLALPINDLASIVVVQ